MIVAILLAAQLQAGPCIEAIQLAEKNQTLIEQSAQSKAAQENARDLRKATQDCVDELNRFIRHLRKISSEVKK